MLSWHKTPWCLLLMPCGLRFSIPPTWVSPEKLTWKLCTRKRQRSWMQYPNIEFSNHALKEYYQSSSRWHKWSRGMAGPWTILLCSTASLILGNCLLLQIHSGDPKGKYFTAIIWRCRHDSRHSQSCISSTSLPPALPLLHWFPGLMLLYLLLSHIHFWERASLSVKLDRQDLHSWILKMQCKRETWTPTLYSSALFHRQVTQAISAFWHCCSEKLDLRDKCLTSWVSYGNCDFATD